MQLGQALHLGVLHALLSLLSPAKRGRGTRWKAPPCSHTRFCAVSGLSQRGRPYAASINTNSPSLSHTLPGRQEGRFTVMFECSSVWGHKGCSGEGTPGAQAAAGAHPAPARPPPPAEPSHRAVTGSARVASSSSHTTNHSSSMLSPKVVEPHMWGGAAATAGVPAAGAASAPRRRGRRAACHGACAAELSCSSKRSRCQM